MKKLSIIAVAAFSILLLAFKPLNTIVWSSDTGHSRLGFSVTHLGIAELNGNFGTYDVKLTSSKPDYSDAVVQLTGEPASVFTGNEGRDKHLKSADFFDAEKFPKFEFKSTSFKKVNKNEYAVKGDLTMHGVTKEVILKAKQTGTVTHPMSKKEMVGFEVTGNFKRSDFGIGGSIPEMMVSDLVSLDADLELVKE
jgi:polyisoprenoid-binding protein YceI